MGKPNWPGRFLNNMQIQINFSDFQNYLFFGILLLMIIIFARKKNTPLSFDLGVTNEIKGIAILMVVFAHIGYFLVTDHRFLFPLSVGGGIGVNLFFFLSGYGLSVSAIKKNLSVLDFYKKRVIKLFIPLWIILAAFLLLDYFLLNRIYPSSEIWHSFLGYFPAANLWQNINSPLWFITPITIYYLFFPIIFNKKYLSFSGIFLILGAYFLLTNNFVLNFLISNNLFKADVLALYRTHYFAFPLGLIAADLITNKSITQKVWNTCAMFFSNHKKILFLIYYFSLFVALYIAYYTAIYSGVGKGEYKEQLFSLITSAAIVYIFVFNKFKFGLFSVIGMYSYEIYLIHWPILSRFDIFYKYLPPFLATSLYLILFIFLGFIINKLVNLISSKVFKIV